MVLRGIISNEALFSDKFLCRIIGFEAFQNPSTRLAPLQQHPSQLALQGFHCSVSCNSGTITSSSSEHLRGMKKRQLQREISLSAPSNRAILNREKQIKGTRTTALKQKQKNR